jgi:hypothetical protein
VGGIAFRGGRPRAPRRPGRAWDSLLIEQADCDTHKCSVLFVVVVVVHVAELIWSFCLIPTKTVQHTRPTAGADFPMPKRRPPFCTTKPLFSLHIPPSSPCRAGLRSRRSGYPLRKKRGDGNGVGHFPLRFSPPPLRPSQPRVFVAEDAPRC